MVCRGGSQHSWTGYVKRNEYGTFKAECFSRLRAWTAFVFWYRNRRWKILQWKVCNLHCDAGRKSQHFLYGFAYNPTALPWNTFSCRWKRRCTEKPLCVLLWWMGHFAEDWFGRDDVFSLPFKAVADSTNHSILCTVGEKLRKRGCWCYHRQHTADNLRRLCSQQRICTGTVQGSWFKNSNVRFCEQE